jgi:putative transposase
MPAIENKFPQREKLPHGTPPWVKSDAIFFITICCTLRGKNQLCIEPVAAAIWESIAFRQNRRDWFVPLWLLMPEHLHALVSFPHDSNPAKVIANWKEITAKKTGIMWQRDFFDHRLRSDESHEEKANYIRQNPVRKGLVTKAEDRKFVWESARPDGGPSTVAACSHPGICPHTYV